MAKYAVDLINRDMGFNTPPRLVQDRNGITIGRSKWNPKYHCHSLVEPLSMEVYEKVIDRLAQCWHLAMMKWQPRFVVIEEAAPTATADSGASGITATIAPPFSTAQHPASAPLGTPPHPSAQSPNATLHTENELCEMHHKSREKLARGLGIDVALYQGNAIGMVEAILKAEAAPREAALHG